MQGCLSEGELEFLGLLFLALSCGFSNGGGDYLGFPVNL